MAHPTSRVSRGAIAGMIALGTIVAFSSVGIVKAERVTPAAKSKTFSCSSGTACIVAKSTGSAYGLYSTSSGLHGIYGQTTTATGGYAGVYGIATQNGYGVYGASSDASGSYGALAAYGANSTTNLMIAYNNATKGKCIMDPSADFSCSGALSGTSAGEAAGVTGKSTANGGTGVYGSTGQGYGIYATTADAHGYPVLAAVGTTSSTYLFLANDATNDQDCEIDPNANLSCSGSISGDDLRVRQPTSTGRKVLAYAAKSTSPTLEDVGTGQMVDGVANVRFESDFSATIDNHTWYYVFLTPLGDTRGLYVSRKTAAGFQVRETERGRSTLQFDYRIVARPLGSNANRLPPAPEVRIPRHQPAR